MSTDFEHKDFCVDDFDDWAELAKRDPVAFEKCRRVQIERLIERATPGLQPRLRGLQFRIDMERRKVKTPLASLVRMQSMMWDAFVELKDTLNGQPAERRDSVTGMRPAIAGPGAATAPETSAQIIPLRR